MSATSSVSGELSSIAKGGAFQLLGRIFSALLAFGVNVLVIRYLSREQYGLITLAYTFSAMLVVLSTLGLNSGMPRFIAASFKDDNVAISQVFVIVFPLILCISVLASWLAYYFSDSISSLLSKPDFQHVLEMLIWITPMIVVLRLFVFVFRGYGNARAKLYFEDLLLPFLKLAFIVMAIVLGAGLNGVLGAYIVSELLVAGSIALYSYYKLNLIKGGVNVYAAAALLRFSAPLLTMELLVGLHLWIAIFLLGLWAPAEQIALYSAPLRIANFITLPLHALLFLYLPSVTCLVASRQNHEVSSLYGSTTKWAFMMALPVILVCGLDGDYFLSVILGAEYLDARLVLVVLVVGLSVHCFVGPNGPTLVAMGKPGAAMISSSIALILSLACCAWLIPLFGALGAAVGVSIGKIGSNIYLGLSLYRCSGLHAFRAPLLVPAGLTIVVAVCLKLICVFLNWENSWVHIGLLIIYCILPFVSLILTKSLDLEDLAMIAGFEKKLFGSERSSHWLLSQGWVRATNN